MVVPKTMKLYAAGFNAWNQLLLQPNSHNSENLEDSEPEDLYSLQLVLEGYHIDSPMSRLSYTLGVSTTPLYIGLI